VKRRVTVLGGGPDAERAVSLESSRALADALAGSARFEPTLRVIDRLTPDEVRALPGEVLVPVLHGPWGEGGPLQALLELDGRPFVGCRASAARLAMDKMATKQAALRAGVATLPAGVLNPADDAPPLPTPLVLKPVHEGSSVGVHIVKDPREWPAALAAVRADRSAHPDRVYMVESAALGARELTVSVLDGEALAPIEIIPAAEFYDYQAKYHRDDTRYVCDPDLPAGVGALVRDWAGRVSREVGVRHLCRVDFLLDRDGRPWMLEVNTMPGFTSHSLFPMAARHAGLSFTALAERLVDAALRDAEGAPTRKDAACPDTILPRRVSAGAPS
jgi:D-alanine-D-alanine ligase